MFNKKTDSNSTTMTETMIGKGTKISGGLLTGTSSLRVDGEFLGTIDIDGHLILGEGGRIEGDIKVRSAVIAGHSKSNSVVCKEAFHIVSTGAVYGDIQVGSLIVDEDAVFMGNCKMNREGVNDLTKPNKSYGFKAAEEAPYGKIEVPY